MTTPRRIGVEEEMFLVDARTRRLVPAADRAVQAPESHAELDQELFLEQVEIQSAPHRDISELLRDLRDSRRTAVSAAEAVGAELAAMPTSVVAAEEGRVTPKERYEHMVSRFGEVGRRALVNGTHVHVDVSDDEEAVAVVDRLTPWLPLVLALSTNSPFHAGTDTGYASWRSETWEAWPSAGPVEPFGDAAGYRRSVTTIIEAGAALDEGMIYFDARLARSFPTVEIRVADVCTDLEDTAVVAAVLRGLVDTCAAQWRDGQPLAPWRIELTRAARWRARRDGLTAELIDPLTGHPVEARTALETLVQWIAPALDEHGDRDLVQSGVERLLTAGTGAERQRTVAGPDLDTRAVVDDVVRRTHDSISA